MCHVSFPNWSEGTTITINRKVFNDENSCDCIRMYATYSQGRSPTSIQSASLSSYVRTYSWSWTASAFMPFVSLSLLDDLRRPLWPFKITGKWVNILIKNNMQKLLDDFYLITFMFTYWLLFSGHENGVFLSQLFLHLLSNMGLMKIWATESALLVVAWWTASFPYALVDHRMTVKC